MADNGASGFDLRSHALVPMFRDTLGLDINDPLGNRDRREPIDATCAPGTIAQQGDGTPTPFPRRLSDVAHSR